MSTTAAPFTAQTLADARRLAGSGGRAEARPLEGEAQTRASTVASCTSSTRRPSTSGSVSGRTPCPRLKMCPGRPPARCEHLARRRLDALPRAEQDGRVEVPLDGMLLADLVPAAVERHAPVEADDVSSRRRHVPEQRGRADAEVDRRRVDCCRARVPTRAPRTRRSRTARARLPTSRRAGSRPLRRATCAATYRANVSESRSMSTSQAPGSRYMNAFTRAKSRLGRPSTR